MSSSNRFRGAVRGLNGISLLCMTLIVGGTGMRLMADGHLAVALVLQLPLYSLLGLTWGVFAGAPWVRRWYVPGYVVGAIGTLILYIVLYRGHIAAQMTNWLDAVSLGFGGALTILIGQPALFWLTLLFVAAPGLLWLSRGMDGHDGDLGTYLTS